MKSVIAFSALCATIFGQSATAASIRHGHQHLHARRSAAAAPAAAEKRAVQFISTADIAALGTIKVGINAPNTAGGPITVGQKGPYVVEFNNKGDEDIVVIVWSGAGLQGSADASFIAAQQPDVTHTLQANTTTWVSFDPAANGGPISGAFGALYPGQGLTQWGQLDQTIGEFTFTGDSVFSTTDVSRLIQMDGKGLEIHNYATQKEANDDAIKPACSSTMNDNVFVCPSGQTTCMVGTIQNCVPGTPNTTCDASKMNGGCSGFGAKGGYAVVNFS